MTTPTTSSQTPTHDTNKSTPKQHVAELARKFDTAFLVTRGQGGQLHARPMGIADVEGAASLWFATRSDSLKVEELQHDPQVLVLMQDGRKRSLSIAGAMRVVKDDAKARELWSPGLKLWFDGPDDPTLVLLEVEPATAEYWDGGTAAGARLALTALKRYIAGEQLTDEDMGESHGRVVL